MSDVITRIKLETTQYDSKLRDAAKNLKEFTNTASMAGSDFNKFTQSSVAAAQAFGQVASGATNTKDKLKDLVGAYNDVARAYNKLTQEQQQSDFAKAMAGSLQQLQVRIREAKQELYSVGDAAKSVGSDFGDKMSGALSVFGGNLMTKGVTMAAGALQSLAAEIGDTIRQGIELAKQGEGIRIAFARLGRGDILDGLREATHGTVSDIELMKAAVKFQDFKLPLDQLGTMLAFAQQKAKDTGQSVDYMVDSIVTGLGRKSLMILDNLGLSAAEIKEKMKETGDMTTAVGAIIREQMSKAGDYVETAADRALQAQVSLQNKMEELGRQFAPLEEASNQLWTSMKISILDVVSGPLARLINGLSEAGRLTNNMNNMAGGNSNNETEKQLRFLRNTSPQNRKERFDKQVAIYNQRESDEWRKANYLRANGASSYLVEQAERNAKSWQMFRMNYIAGAKPLLGSQNQPTSVVDTTTNTGKGGGGKGTRTLSEAEKAAEDIAKAEKDYATALKNAGIKKSESLITGDEYDKQMLSAQQRLSEAYLKAYDVTGNEEYLNTFKDHAQSIRTQKETMDANTAAQKADELVIRQHEAAVKKLYEEEKKQAELARTWQTSNSQGIGNYIGKQQGALSTAIYGSSEYATIAGNLADATAYKELMQKAIQTGMNDIVVDSAPLWSRIINAEDIDDNDWQALVDKINEKLAEMELNPIEIDFSTGKVKEQSKEMTKDWNAAASAIQAVGSAMMQIEDPAAKVMGTIAQAIATIALTFAKSLEGTFTPWDWIASAAAGTATMISTISAIKSATAGSYATGGIVPGNNHNDGLIANVSSGELILNAAQQGNIASLLSDRGSQVGDSLSYVSGENIILGVNNTLMRKGKGEIVTTSMLRSKGIL